MKTLKYTLLAAVSILVAASCTKEQAGGDIQTAEGVDVKAVFEAVAEDDMSKALLQSNGGLKWEDGDQIGVYQYKNYATGANRDRSKNIFTSDGTCRFEGSIAGYMPLGVGGTQNRYYAAYPASRYKAGGSTTGKYTVEIPATQTGLQSDFDDYAIYVGSLRETSTTVSYDAENSILTFLAPFNMYCITPVLKFNVPASLKTTRIVLTAQDVDGATVNLAGRIEEIRSDATNTPTPVSKYGATEVTIENGGEVLSGDVYVVLAPNKNLNSNEMPHPKFWSTAKTLNLNLFKASGASASLSLPLAGEVLAGTIKNLPSIPENIAWVYPAGPGLSAIEINKTAITSTSGSSLSSKTRILLTPENSESTITYRSRTSLSGLLGSTIMNPYNSTNGILRSDAETPENYLEINVATEGYEDYSAYACTWILNKNYGFGEQFSAAASTLAPEVGSTYPADGSYLYNLSFVYDKVGTVNSIPHISSDGFYLFPSNDNTAYSYGKLRIKVPETGTASLFFDYSVTTNSRSIYIKRGDETLDTIATGKKETYGNYRVVKSDAFDVVADDILEISLSKDVMFYSITLLWQPTVTEASLSTESYSTKTSYGN